MNLTLALGLKYESPQKIEFSPSQQEGLSSSQKQVISTRNTELKSQSIIDVKPIDSVSPSSLQTINKHYNYLSYNMHATLNILHSIGTQLHITI